MPAGEAFSTPSHILSVLTMPRHPVVTVRLWRRKNEKPGVKGSIRSQGTESRADGVSGKIEGERVVPCSCELTVTHDASTARPSSHTAVRVGAESRGISLSPSQHLPLHPVPKGLFGGSVSCVYPRCLFLTLA